MNIIQFLKSEGQPNYKNTIKKIALYIPSFIKDSKVTLETLLMRITSSGLTISEIDDILSSINNENRVHVRRPGKKRLFCKAFLERSPSEEEELAEQKQPESKSKRVKQCKPNIECNGPGEM